MDDRKLTALLQQTKPTLGWGSHRTIAGKKVFVKCVPVTEREYRNAYSTRNHHQLPSHYSYGVGSGGFGVFRELAAHVKTTNWVLSGAIESFPLMYHHRILPRIKGPRSFSERQIDGYVKYWNGSQRVGRFIRERGDAKHEAAIFSEHMPFVLSSWLPKHVDKLQAVLSQMQQAVGFLRDRGVIHFDSHSANILIRGHNAFLTDYGLVLDGDFDLDERERKFLRAHHNYDAARLVHWLISPLHQAPGRWDEATAQKLTQRYGRIDPATLLQNVEDLNLSGHLALAENYMDALLQYRDVILKMEEFLVLMRGGNKKNVRYEDKAIGALLKKAGGRVRTPGRRRRTPRG